MTGEVVPASGPEPTPTSPGHDGPAASSIDPVCPLCTAPVHLGNRVWVWLLTVPSGIRPCHDSCAGEVIRRELGLQMVRVDAARRRFVVPAEAGSRRPSRESST
jgi:hypothetical protein